MATGLTFEQECADELRRVGCAVDHFGQELVKKSVRAWLAGTGSPLRWLPDLVVWKPGTGMHLADAKTKVRLRETGNASIEMRSLWTSWWLDIPVWYLCKTPDGIKTITAEQIREDGVDGSCCQNCRAALQAVADIGGKPTDLPKYCPRRAQLQDNASGTPFGLVAYRRMRPLADVFGVRPVPSRRGGA